VEVTALHKNIYREGINQKVRGRIIKPRKVLDQFKERFKMELLGSNTENKLVITFN
jgi:hypothetical protein